MAKCPATFGAFISTRSTTLLLSNCACHRYVLQSVHPEPHVYTARPSANGDTVFPASKAVRYSANSVASRSLSTATRHFNRVPQYWCRSASEWNPSRQSTAQSISSRRLCRISSRTMASMAPNCRSPSVGGRSNKWLRIR